jgi:quinol monooxygenase YgiN
VSDPVVVTVTFVPVAGALEQVSVALQRSIAEVHTEAGCELFALHQVPDGTLFMIEKWTTAADLDAHAAGEIVKRLDASIEGLLARPAVVTRIAPLPAGTSSQGQL